MIKDAQRTQTIRHPFQKLAVALLQLELRLERHDLAH